MRSLFALTFLLSVAFPAWADQIAELELRMRDDSLSYQDRAAAAAEILKLRPDHSDAKAYHKLLVGRVSNARPIEVARAPDSSRQAGRQAQSAPALSRLPPKRLSRVGDVPEIGNESAAFAVKEPLPRGMVDRWGRRIGGWISDGFGVPDERREAVAQGAIKGVGAGATALGTVGTIAGVARCSPALPTGGPFAACVAASGGGSALAGGFIGGFVGGGYIAGGEAFVSRWKELKSEMTPER